MEKLFVDLGKKSYDILFSDSFNGLAKAMSDINAPKKLLVVTDSNVEKLYGRRSKRFTYKKRLRFKNIRIYGR